MSSTVDRAVNIAGDFLLVPGTSQILKGEYTSGLLHAGVGIASRVLLGTPVGTVVWLVAAANSYSRTERNQNLIDLSESDKEQVDEGVAVVRRIMRKLEAGEPLTQGESDALEALRAATA